MSGCST